MSGWRRARRIPWLIGVLSGLLLLAVGGDGRAQVREKRGSFREQFGQAIDRARRQVETLYVLRLSETLDLTTEQSAQVAVVIRKAQELRRGLLEERTQIFQELNDLVTSGAKAERIKAKLVQWEQNEIRLGRWRQVLFQELARLLSVEQQGRFLLFDENFTTEVRNAVLELRGSGASEPKP